MTHTKNIILWTIVTLILINIASATTIIGWDYNTNREAIKELINELPSKELEGLDRLYFTESQCVQGSYTQLIMGGYIQECAEGLTTIWENGLTKIVIKSTGDKQEIKRILTHELGHLKDYREGTIWDKTINEREEYADNHEIIWN